MCVKLIAVHCYRSCIGDIQTNYIDNKVMLNSTANRSACRPSNTVVVVDIVSAEDSMTAPVASIMADIACPTGLGEFWMARSPPQSLAPLSISHVATQGHSCACLIYATPRRQRMAERTVQTAP